MRWPRGITWRIALLGWLVTLIALAVFVAAIIPEQKRDFELGLESKARGIAASIKGVTAGAAVSEDYSVVVDQASQVLAGDEAIEYLVITKNDGFSIVSDRSGWRIERLGSFWRPSARVPRAGIGVTPEFGRRVFQYAHPLDFSGIEWGWIHTGLSLDSYDASVRRVYRRTGALALVCGLLSLGVSLLYARRLVKPLAGLQQAVEDLARGNLHARAAAAGGDEVERLAHAFNDMAAAILARNRILESVGFAAQQLLNASDWDAAVEQALERAGSAAGASRACVIERAGAAPHMAYKLRQEWLAPGVSSLLQDWENLPWDSLAFEGPPEKGRVFTAKPKARTDSGDGGKVRSWIAMPIFASGEWWGFVAFCDCHQARDWAEAERYSLRTVAEMLGASIERNRAQEALIEAKETLEGRVVERTLELREQIQAKDKAHTALASAQQRMIELSRQAGMAEVATGVIHNVGNVLNSINVAVSVVEDKLRASRVGRLRPLAGLLEEHQGDLAAFLANDPKGRRIVPYLTELGGYLVEERDGMMAELAQLSQHVGHIKEIVAMQQGYATTSGFLETVSMQTVVEDAIAICRESLDRSGIRLARRFEKLPPVLTDKHKVLQILLNLLRNARDAVRDSARADKAIAVELRAGAQGYFEIEVADNGAGLPAADLQRIFQHGFTTKKGGHGFGLHSGALAAADLGGTLTATSNGPGQGAAFTLRLPLRAGAAGRGSEDDRAGRAAPPHADRG